MEFKSISDELTIEEFNAIVSMYRHFKTIKKPLRINEQVLGDYGTYNFNMDGVTFVDNGILITNETIQAEPSVLLTDNQFTHSTYTLTLQVLHNTSLNIFDDDVKDFKVVETLDLELIPDEEIKIPVDELEQGYIISFDSFIEIKHDKTIMQGEIPEPTIIDDIVLTSDKDILSYVDGDVANLSAQLMMEGEPASVSGETVTFEVYKESDDSLIETLTGTTNVSGSCSVSYTSKGTGDIYINASCMNVSKTYDDMIDAHLYRENPTAQTGLNIPLPSKARISFNLNHKSSTGGIDLLLQDDSHDYYVGNWSSHGNNGVLIRNIGSSSNLVGQRCSDISFNTEHTCICSYANGEWMYQMDNETKSFTANYTPSKLVTIDIGSNNVMTDLLIITL